MNLKHQSLKLQTKEGFSISNITRDVTAFVRQSDVLHGFVLVFTQHTTTGLCINEDEKLLLQDIQRYLESAVPRTASYNHDNFVLRGCLEDERKNGHAHLKALHLNTSEIIPIVDGRLAFGRWQSLLFLDCDGGRERTLVVQIVGGSL